MAEANLSDKRAWWKGEFNYVVSVEGNLLPPPGAPLFTRAFLVVGKFLSKLEELGAGARQHIIGSRAHVAHGKFLIVACRAGGRPTPA